MEYHYHNWCENCKPNPNWLHDFRLYSCYIFLCFLFLFRIRIARNLVRVGSLLQEASSFFYLASILSFLEAFVIVDATDCLSLSIFGCGGFRIRVTSELLPFFLSPSHSFAILSLIRSWSKSFIILAKYCSICNASNVCVCVYTIGLSDLYLFKWFANLFMLFISFTRITFSSQSRANMPGMIYVYAVGYSMRSMQWLFTFLLAC